MKILFAIAVASGLNSCNSNSGFNQGIQKVEEKLIETNPVEILTSIDTNEVECILLNPLDEDEIYNMQLSVHHFEWKNPTSGGAVHINMKDEIEIYQSTLGFNTYTFKINSKGDSSIYTSNAPKDTSFIVKTTNLIHHVGGMGFGNPSSVLITSEYDLKKSKSLDSILNELNGQVFYLKKN